MLVSISVEEVMQRPLVTVGPDTSIADAAGRLTAEEIGSVVVTDGAEPIGILTDADVVGLFARGADRSTPVREVMSSPVLTIDADESIEAAARKMRDSDVPKLAVCEVTGGLAGVITTTDLADYVPAMARRAIGHHEPSTHRRSTRPDTAYEHDEWDFESFGENEDRIDVGDVVTFGKAFTEADVSAFAEASGDTNRLHVEDAFAAETRFGRRIVHGTLVAGLISAALARLPGLTIYLSQDVTYSGPVDIGARATARCEVLEDLGKGRFRLATDVLVDDEPVIEGEATVLSDPIP
jgi:acyl dehydratase/CBS domain-containing protein